MKFNQYAWSLYKSSEKGKKTIENFYLADTIEHLAEIYYEYNAASSLKFETRCDVMETLFGCNLVNNCDCNKEYSADEAMDMFHDIISSGLIDGDETYLYPGDFRNMLRFIPDISLMLSVEQPKWFIPYLFECRFGELVKIADLFDIILPNIPPKNDFEGCCMYYWFLCQSLCAFRDDNNLSNAELCAFLYDYAPNLIKEDDKHIERHQNIWITGGYADGVVKENCYWGSNPETKRGDLVLVYELAPKSSITKLYMALTDGIRDPFFEFHSEAFLQPIADLPTISFKELRNDCYFKDNYLVRRKMQGVNGSSLSAKDYLEFKRLWKMKGFDTSVLPALDKYLVRVDSSIKIEKDVEEKLLIPLLSKFGLENGRDFIQQLPIHAGRGSRIYPDFALFYNDSKTEPSAEVLIEAKLHIKNNKEKTDAFIQAKSYANLLQSRLIVLCDDSRLIVYPKENNFDRSRYEEFYWSELSDPDILKRLRKYVIG